VVAGGGGVGKPQQIFLSFGGHERALAETAAAIFRGYGDAGVTVRERPERNTCETIVHCTRLAGLFASLFGRRAENKRLPHWTMTLPRARQATLLRTLWQCDGYAGVVRGYPRATYVTVSPALAFQVHQLLLRQGIPATLLRREPAKRQPAHYLSVTSAEGLRRFAEVTGVDLPVPAGRRAAGHLGLDDRYLYLPVRGVGRVPYHGTVYNLEVARAHTYVSSLSLVHNCIVNGPGEMADADYGYVGKGEGLITLYRGREIVKNMVPAERGVEELVALIKADGQWEEPS
jgi:hypothetical protein